jgi:hypothetical protein
MDVRLLAALRDWLSGVWGFGRPVYVTNERFEQQVGVLERAGLRRRFELLEPDKPGRYLAFG